MTGVSKSENRMLIAVMGTLLQMCLGTVYAWSFFQKPIIAEYGWSNTEAAWVFSLAICFLGLAAAWGGMNLAKFGFRRLAVSGAVLYGCGYLLGAAALHLKSLIFLYLGFGVIGGIGLGLGYVTPVAAVSKWFPDKKGLITGMVVMGFGLGALLMSKLLAPILMNLTDGNLVQVFSMIGAVILVLGVFSALFLKSPPEGFIPQGYTPPQKRESEISDSRMKVSECLASRQFILMWLIFFANICAGIMFVGFQSPMIQDLLKESHPEMSSAALAAAGATLIGVSSLFNGVGRFLWGGISDKIGRVETFRLIIGLQIVIFTALIFVKNPIVFGALVCIILLCYGGGFGAMPSFVLDVFGPRNMPVVYGAILTAWSMGGIAGPQIAALIKDSCGSSASTFTFTAGAVLLIVGFLISFGLQNQPAVKAQKQ